MSEGALRFCKYLLPEKGQGMASREFKHLICHNARCSTGVYKATR
jgi:hypothetical protein